MDAEGFTAVDSQVSVPNPLTEFDLLSEEDITKYTMRAPGKSCLLDPIPKWFVKQHVEMFAPIITCIVNKLLSRGVFPESLKHAIVSPFIKKPSLNPEILKNYRPVSNITYLSKIIEKHAVLNTANHIAINHLGDSLQSAYKPVHSTETALLKVKSHIMQHLSNRQDVFWSFWTLVLVLLLMLLIILCC